MLSDAEISRFWAACDKIHPVFASVFRLLLITGQRKSEFAGMRWDELNGDVLDLPGARTKNGLPHLVPLPPLAMETIMAQPRIEGSRFVFSTTGKTSISGWTKIKRDLDKAMGNPPPWVIHDLRRTAVTGMNERGIPPQVVEKIVNHQSGHLAGVAGVYNKSELLDERRKALRRWATHISGLVSGDTKVIPYRSR